jgi:hypothetical protein
MPAIAFARMSKPGVQAQAYSGERLLNWFLRPVDGVSQGALIGRSGLVEQYDLGLNVRAAIESGEDLYAVAEERVWKVSGGSITQVGVVPDGVTSIAASGAEVAIVVDETYYVCDGSTTTEYSTGAVDVPRFVAYQDGYFIVAGEVAGRNDGFTVSGLNDGTTFNALDFAFAENTADEVTGLVSDHNELWFFGARTVERFYNSGAGDFPFVPNRSALIQSGCLDGQTISAGDSALFWVREDRKVVRASGSVPQVISTREVEEYLVGKTVGNGFHFTDRGHQFYALSIEGHPTLCYDLTTGLWCEFSTGATHEPWIANGTVWNQGTQYVMTSTGKLATFDESTFTDDGAIIRAEGYSIPIEFGGGYQRLNHITAHVDSGRTSHEISPQIGLRVSRNGRTWGDEMLRDLAETGEYWKRAVWRGLGASRRFQVRLWMTDAVSRDCPGVYYG